MARLTYTDLEQTWTPFERLTQYYRAATDPFDLRFLPKHRYRQQTPAINSILFALFVVSAGDLKVFLGLNGNTIDFKMEESLASSGIYFFLNFMFRLILKKIN
jgi:hypothetical protein